nr:metallophosphoesterase family protein [Candidatus Sigynarchaeota archaeon]
MKQPPSSRGQKKTPKKKVLFQLRNVGLVILVFSPLGLYILANQLNMDLQPMEKAPFAHFNGLNPSKEMYITWETADAKDSALLLGISRSSLALNMTNATASTIHRIKLTNLQANTRYYYKVESNSSTSSYVSPIQTFLTAPIDALPFTSAFFSDSQQLFGIGHYERIANILARYDDFSFIAALGDLAQIPDSQSDWNLFMQQSNGWMKQVPIVPSIGNHDSTFDSGTGTYNDPAHFMYLKYFGFSYTTGQWANHFFYSFNWSNVQFVVGEIGEASQENIALMDQGLWFNQTLAKGQDKAFRILVFHRSLFSSVGNHPDYIARIKPIVDAYNVSLVMYGHDHHYERFLVNDHTYLCLGGGGGLQDTGFNIVPESQFINVGPSYTTVHYEIDRLIVETRSEENGLIESFTLVANGSRAELLTGGVG